MKKSTYAFVDESEQNLSERRYYASPRAFVNPIWASLNAQSASSHKAKQEYIL